MANYYTHYSFHVPHPDASACRQRLIDNQQFLEALAIASGYEAGEWEEARPIAESLLYVSIDDEKGFWLTDGAEHSTDLAVIASQWILKDQNSDAIITFQAAFTCDKPRIDAFGGMVCVFNKDRIITRTTGDEDLIEGLKVELKDDSE